MNTTSHLCPVSFTFGSFVNTLTVTSPKTGRTISLSEGSFRHCLEVVGKVVKALPRGGRGMVALTVADLRAVLEAQESARESYKSSMSREDECIASEETDGECPHCEAKFAGRRF
jgi:hypothetical protein